VLFQKFNETFWNEAEGFYAYALDGEKRPVLSIASNPGQCLWSGIVPPDRARRVADRLMKPDMWSGWGIRTLSADHKSFNPFNYQTGAVWPHDNGFIAQGMKRYGFHDETCRIAEAITRAAGYFAMDQMPELYAGTQRDGSNFPVQYLGANVPQGWAAGSIFSLLQAMLGFQPDAPNKMLYVDPALPDWMPELTVRDLRVGSLTFDIRFARKGEVTEFEVTRGPKDVVVRRSMTEWAEALRKDAAFLAEQNWTQQSIGFVLTAGGLAGLLSQLPGGALLDAIRSKRIAVALGAGMVAAGALIIALWPSFPLVLAALVLQGTTGGFLGLAIVAISLGVVGNAALGERLGRNQRFASTGGVVAAGLMGLIAYFLSFRAIFFVAAALVLPLLWALGRIRSEDIHFGRASCLPDHEGPSKPQRVGLRSLWKNRGLLIFAGCVFLFQMANASMLPLAGEDVRVQQGSSFLAHRLGVDHGAPDHRGDNSAMGGTQGEHVGPPAAAARRIRGVADPCADLRLDHRSR
jgi:hypothetical protein